MEFIKYIDNKEIITEAFAEVEVVEEGWAQVIFDGPIPREINAAKISKLFLRNKKLVAYVKSKCDQAFNSKKREDKSVTKDIPEWERFKDNFKSYWKVNSDDISFMDTLKSHIKLMRDFDAISQAIGGYSLKMYYDSEHIQALFLYLYSKDRDKVYSIKIAAPTKDELFHEK